MKAQHTLTSEGAADPTNADRNAGVAVEGPSNTQLVAAAKANSNEAWELLVDRYAGLVWHVIRSFRLDDATAHDVSQVVWLKAVEHLDQLRDPERIGSWLATTARNAAIAEFHRRNRQVPVGSEIDGFDVCYESPDPVVEQEEHAALLRAFRMLSPGEQQLLRLSVTEPDLSYEDVGWIISRPIGSIGPSRARALSKLRGKYEAELVAKQPARA